MTRFLLVAITLFLSANVGAQHSNLSDYSFVIVPEQFDFQKRKDQFQLNSMTKFYFEKSGFNAYLADSAPNANRCDGLYANVEELKTLFGTKLQVVLKDCNDNEIYRSQEGKSKYKDFEKTYQDALRKAFNSVVLLKVNQKDVVLLPNAAHTTPVVSESETLNVQPKEPKTPNTARVSEKGLPDAKFSNYSLDGNTFLLRKTREGYSLYEETVTTAEGLLLKGKIIIMDTVVKYMDTTGKVFDAAFDPSGNLVITGNNTALVYKAED